MVVVMMTVLSAEVNDGRKSETSGRYKTNHLQLKNGNIPLDVDENHAKIASDNGDSGR
jgi:hypothetical protein